MTIQTEINVANESDSNPIIDVAALTIIGDKLPSRAARAEALWSGSGLCSDESLRKCRRMCIEPVITSVNTTRGTIDVALLRT